jgi:hypothetical protein
MGDFLGLIETKEKFTHPCLFGYFLVGPSRLVGVFDYVKTPADLFSSSLGFIELDIGVKS